MYLGGLLYYVGSTSAFFYMNCFIFNVKRYNIEIWAAVLPIPGLLRSGIGIFSMSQEFLEIWAGVPFIPGPSRSGLVPYKYSYIARRLV